MSTKNTDLAIIPASDYAIVTAGEGSLKEVIEENFGEGGKVSPSDLTRIPTPLPADDYFKLPTLGKPEVVETFEGVIIYWKDVRAFWEGSDPKKGVRPDCSSEGAVVGQGMFGPGSVANPSGKCATCPMAKFGSATGPDGKERAGQACKLRRMLFILRPGDDLPVVLSVPPGSWANAKAYFSTISGARRPYYTVITRFGIRKQTNTTGTDYAQITFNPAAPLSPEEVTVFKGLNTTFKGLMESVDLADYEEHAA